MNGLHTFLQLNLKRKFLVLVAIAAWYFSILFSKNGFAIDNPNMVWLGWGLGIIVTAMELAFNDRTVKQTLTIIILGVICYSYGVWTNVTGFYAAQHPGEVFIPLSSTSLMAWFVGLILEILPEPLFMMAIGRGREADPLGALADVTSGKLNLDGGGGSASSEKPNYNESYRKTDQPKRDEPNPLLREVFMKDLQNKGKQNKGNQPHKYHGE